METKNRNGVLGLDTAKGVMITFLILAVTGIAVILSLSSLSDSISGTIDSATVEILKTNQSNASMNVIWLNQSGYTLSVVNSSNSNYIISAIWGDGNQSNGSQSGSIKNPTGYTFLLNSANYSVTAGGVLRNASTLNYPNVSVTYYYTYAFDNQRSDVITGNVSSGIVTFFGSTGTIFSILLVVVIILAISIIIWAISRFGNQTESVNDVRL